MALLVPAIGEDDSLRYLLGANTHVPNLSDTSPRNLVLKLFSSNTVPADADVPSRLAYYEPYLGGTNAASCGYGTTAVTGYPLVANNRADQDYSNTYGILLNGSRWQIIKSGGTGLGATVTTATYPEQTFTFTGTTSGNTNADYIYGYYLARAQNLPVGILGVADAATVGIGTTIAKGTTANPTIGIVGNSYFTVDAGVTIDDVTIGMGVTHVAITGQTVGIATTAKVVGLDRLNKIVYLDSPLIANIQVATGCTVAFNYSKVSTGSSAHRLVAGDVLYIQGNGTGISSATYTVFSVPNQNEFYTTPSIRGTGTATLLNSIFYAERFTNGPYRIQNPGDQIKVTLNVTLE